MNDPSERRPTPEDEGIPDYADDTSTAFDDEERPRFNDSPATLPADHPQALDEHGITAGEQQRGESLAARLAREEHTGDDPAQDPAGAGDEYDTRRDFGRGVEPDEGVRPDEEKDLVADDAGSAGGGLSAEEEAVHRTPEDPFTGGPRTEAP